MLKLKFKNMKHSLKFLILIYVILIIVTFSFFSIDMINEKSFIDTDREALLNNAEVETNNKLAQTALDIIGIKNMLGVLSNQNDIDYYNSTDGRDEIENLGINWLTLKNSYYDLSFVDLDGQEFVKIQKGRYDRPPYSVPIKDLNKESLNSIFDNVEGLSNNRVFISDFSTSLIDGTPTIFEDEQLSIYKTITPFYSNDDTNKKLGYVILSVLTEYISDLYGKDSIEAIDSDGNYIYSQEHGDSLYGSLIEENSTEKYQKYNDFDFLLLNNETSTISLTNNVITYKKISKKEINYIINNIASDDIEIEEIGSIILINNTAYNSYSKYSNLYILLCSSFFIDLLIAYIVTLMLDKRRAESAEVINVFQKIADIDELTQVKSRKKFFSDVKIVYDSDSSFSLLYCDLDGFKNVNDTYGHDTGDKVLIEAAKRIKEVLPLGIELYRIGGDEFIILVNSANKNYLETLAKNIIVECNNSITINSNKIKIGISIGISMLVGRKKSLDELIDEADDAMYDSKETRKNKYEFIK